MITVASLFDGIGGTPLCSKMCGAIPVWSSEIEPFPIKVTKHHFPNMKHHGDITKINGAEVEPVDIIIGGSPCQDLSVAGKRAGMKHSDFGDEDATRSGLFMEQIRIVKEMRNGTDGTQPRFMVWENVPGAFSSKGSGDSLKAGEAFRIVLEETARIADPTISIPRSPDGWANSGSILGDGFSISWRTVDAQYWGVPQRRRRIYLVADFSGQTAPEIMFERHFREESGQEVLPIIQSLYGYSSQSQSKGQGAAGEVENRIRTAIICSATQQGGAERLENLCPTITASAGMAGNMGSWIARTAGFIGGNSADAGTIGFEEELAPTCKSNANHVICFEPGAITRDMGERSWSELSPTLRAEMGDNPPAIVYGICSDKSNSMLSDNPHSGIYEADTSRTIDANGGNPACNQGGMLVFEPRSQDGVPRVSTDGLCPTINTAQGGQRQPCIIEPAYTMLMREGKEGGEKGPLIQTDKASTLTVGGQQTLFEPTYSIGNGQVDTLDLHEEITGTLNCMHDQNCVFREGSFGDYVEGEFVTLKSSGGVLGGGSETFVNQKSIRRLTPLECERLQGYPDYFTDIPGSSDSVRYKALGNSFAIPNAYFVISGCVEVLNVKV